MRDFVLKLVTVALLFTTVEGMAEPVDEASFHQTHHAHADEGHEWFPDNDGNDHEAEACEHFCHVHVVALTPQVVIPLLTDSGGFHRTLSIQAKSQHTPPPIPPPNI